MTSAQTQSAEDADAIDGLHSTAWWPSCWPTDLHRRPRLAERRYLHRLLQAGGDAAAEEFGAKSDPKAALYWRNRIRVITRPRAGFGPIDVTILLNLSNASCSESSILPSLLAVSRLFAVLRHGLDQIVDLAHDVDVVEIAAEVFSLQRGAGYLGFWFFYCFLFGLLGFRLPSCFRLLASMHVFSQTESSLMPELWERFNQGPAAAGSVEHVVGPGATTVMAEGTKTIVPTADKVREYLDYNPATGVLMWRHRANAHQRWNTKRCWKIVVASTMADIGILPSIRPQTYIAPTRLAACDW